MKPYALLFVTLCCFACKNKIVKPSSGDVVALVQPPGLATSLPALESAYNKEDSIRKALMTDSILQLAEAHYTDKHFYHKSAHHKILVGNIFSPQKKHALVWINTNWQDDIFVKCRIRLVSLSENEHRSMLDTINEIGGLERYNVEDLNGDLLNDFYIVSYGINGCCRRFEFDIWMYDERTNTFHTQSLMNPTFYPKEKIVRGVEYGHSGQVPLYKLRWKGYELQPVEWIFPVKNTTKRFIRSHTAAPQEGDTIRSLPKEYKTVDDLDYFLLYQKWLTRANKP